MRNLAAFVCLLSMLGFSDCDIVVPVDKANIHSYFSFGVPVRETNVKVFYYNADFSRSHSLLSPH